MTADPMSALLAFLNARLDEDEQIAPRHIARHDPARILREVAFKRAIMAEHYPGTTWDRDAPGGLKICAGEGGDGDTWQMATRWPCPQVRQLAAIYSDHPDYDPEWKPSTP